MVELSAVLFLLGLNNKFKMVEFTFELDSLGISVVVLSISLVLIIGIELL